MKNVILIIYIWFGYCNCFDEITLKPFHLPPLHNKNLCEEDTQSTVVEDFFNTVFAEFPASQPACVCIQLCVGHPTFCYPNGCFKFIQGYVKDRTNSTIVSVTFHPDARSEHDASADGNEETEREKSSEHVSKHEDLSNIFNLRKNTRCKIDFSNMLVSIALCICYCSSGSAITPRNRIFSALKNPFSSRFQLSSYLKKGRRQKLSGINYYELNRAGKTIAPLDAGKISTYPLSVHHTRWPQDKDTVALAQAIGEWGSVLDKNDTNVSFTVNLEDQADVTENKAENELNDEVSENTDSGTRFDLRLMSYTSNETEMAQSNLEVIPVKEDATTILSTSKISDDNFTSDNETQSPSSTEASVLKPINLNANNQSEKLDSITNILLNVTEKENEDYSFDNAKGKSLLFRRLPWFDVRRLKNQMRRKNRLGHLAQAQRFGNKKSNLDFDLESESAAHEFRKNRKRDERTAVDLERRINIGDIEML